jgi:hypothetical protein
MGCQGTLQRGRKTIVLEGVLLVEHFKDYPRKMDS